MSRVYKYKAVGTSSVLSIEPVASGNVSREEPAGHVSCPLKPSVSESWRIVPKSRARLARTEISLTSRWEIVTAVLLRLGNFSISYMLYSYY